MLTQLESLGKRIAWIQQKLVFTSHAGRAGDFGNDSPQATNRGFFHASYFKSAAYNTFDLQALTQRQFSAGPVDSSAATDACAGWTAIQLAIGKHAGIA